MFQESKYSSLSSRQRLKSGKKPVYEKVMYSLKDAQLTGHTTATQTSIIPSTWSTVTLWLTHETETTHRIMDVAEKVPP